MAQCSETCLLILHHWRGDTRCFLARYGFIRWFRKRMYAPLRSSFDLHQFLRDNGPALTRSSYLSVGHLEQWCFSMGFASATSISYSYIPVTSKTLGGNDATVSLPPWMCTGYTPSSQCSLHDCRQLYCSWNISGLDLCRLRKR
ncbi:hypothetical protein PHLGIDRAFT_459693 [Phlebiopsis gigantea 11061_1 CR5-6]|uniref:Uncharacterized protein n=1 Tax=Phlebiopsis gigantea (strain 11061_1 CR5-6) TaxID=745531 RepID=A0A0C3NN39_PHLG1|nr:hypothetical protein PHLGIDRAFT_459693 [Phlebiopsis gigantea 11061_1 CR5-6]